MNIGQAQFIHRHMTTTLSSCIVCGASPTVKAHMAPRALMKDLRGDEKALREANHLEPGWVFRQSGQWDDSFLCAEHEKAFATADDYAVRFYRKLSAAIADHPSAHAHRVPNPKPELLIRFIYATIWRTAMAPRNAKFGTNLGRYEIELRRALFEGGPLNLPALLGISNPVLPDGSAAGFGLLPYRNKILGTNTWCFTIGRLNVHLKTDRRSWPGTLGEFLADNDPAYLIMQDAVDITTAPALRSIASRLLGGSK